MAEARVALNRALGQSQTVVQSEHGRVELRLLAARNGFGRARDRLFRPLWILVGAVVLVLLAACANVSNLLLMRAVQRRREVATRIAIGAGRKALVGQMTIETAIVTMAACVLGIAVAGPLHQALISMIADTPEQVVLAPSLNLKKRRLRSAALLRNGILLRNRPCAATAVGRRKRRA